jgi:pimeloyl-ACP methyl ester carboxylesterase
MNTLGRLCWTLCASLAATSLACARAAPDCHLGSYRLNDRGLVDIAPDGETLSWVKFDGTSGVLHKGVGGVWTSTLGSTDRPDGITASFPNCRAGKIRFGGLSGQRVAFDAKDATFKSHGSALVGRLVMPKGTGRVPIVVFLHGAEQSSSLGDPTMIVGILQRMLAAEGVGAFIYDKRGTGSSGGEYTQDYSLLADDAVAAMLETRELAGGRAGRVGYQGGSQGGWVAPLAANRTAADFVIVSFGLAVNVIDEDQESVEIQMREKGYPPEVIAKAQEVASAAEFVFESDFKGGFERLDEVKAKYGSAPWYKDVQGDFAYFVLQQPSTEALRALAPKFDWHTPFHYDPLPVLRAGKVPQLWIVGGEDYQAPSAETSRRIKSLVNEGKPFTLACYPRAEHGMTLFETGADGSRTSTRFAEGYFRMMRDFARDGRLQGRYGDAELTSR